MKVARKSSDRSNAGNRTEAIPFARAVQLKLASAKTPEEQLAALKPGRPLTLGTPLPEAVQGKMERSFQTDFSGVRVHQGEAAREMGARAYTQGSDVHFAPGQYQPHSTSGQELLGHELAHVVQQKAGRVRPDPGATHVNTDPGLEAEADRAGALAARGGSARVSGAAGPSTQMKAVQMEGEDGPSREEITDTVMEGYSEKLTTIAVNRILAKSDVKDAAKLGADEIAWKVVQDAKIAIRSGQWEPPSNMGQGPAAQNYMKMQQKAKLQMGKATKKTEKEVAKKLAREATQEAAREAVEEIIKDLVFEGHGLVFQAAARGEKAAKKMRDSTYSRHKKFLQTAECLKDARGKAVELAEDKVKDETVQDKVISEVLEGSVNSKLAKLGKAIDALINKDGMESSIEVEIHIPVWEGIFVGFRIKGSASRDEGHTELGLDLAVQAGAEVPLPGGFKLGGLVELGGFLQAQGKNAADAMTLISYGLYRKCRDSRWIPHQIADYMWGMGGKTGGSRKDESEAWARAIEEALLKGEVNEDNFVELGSFLGAKFEVGKEDVFGISGGAEVRAGKRFKGGGSGTAPVRGEKHKQLTAELSVEVGPIGGEVAIAFDRTTGPARLETFEFSLSGKIPMTGMALLIPAVKTAIDGIARVIQKAGGEEDGDIKGQEALIGSAVTSIAEQAKVTAATIAVGEADFVLALEGKYEAEKPFELKLTGNAEIEHKIDAGVAKVDLSTKTMLFEIVLLPDTEPEPFKFLSTGLSSEVSYS